MARVKNQVLGEVRGRVGDAVFKKRYGEVFLYTRPSKSSKPETENCSKNRSRFANIVNLAKEIKRSDVLYKSWELSKSEGKNTYTKILKANHIATLPDKLTVNNLITPQGIFLEVTSPSINDAGVSFSYIIKRPSVNKLKVPYNLSVILFLFTPKNSTQKIKSDFITLNQIINTETGNAVLPFSDAQINLKNKFNKVVIFIAAAKLNDDSPACEWTSTCSAEMDLS